MELKQEGEEEMEEEEEEESLGMAVTIGKRARLAMWLEHIERALSTTQQQQQEAEEGEGEGGMQSLSGLDLSLVCT